MTQEELDRRVANLMGKAFAWGILFGAVVVLVGIAAERALG